MQIKKAILIIVGCIGLGLGAVGAGSLLAVSDLVLVQ